MGEENTIVVKKPYLRRSYQSKIKVWDLLMDAFPGTLILAFLSIIIATIVGIFLGIYLSNFIEGKKLKKGFIKFSRPIFTLVLGIDILIKKL